MGPEVQGQVVGGSRTARGAPTSPPTAGGGLPERPARRMAAAQGAAPRGSLQRRRPRRSEATVPHHHIDTLSHGSVHAARVLGPGRHSRPMQAAPRDVERPARSAGPLPGGRVRRVWQSGQNRRNSSRCDFIVALIAMPEPDLRLFAGLHGVLGEEPRDGEDRVHYRTSRRAACDEFDGRLVVAFKRPGRQPYPFAEKLASQLTVHAIRPRKQETAELPGYRSVRLTKHRLDRIVNARSGTWRSALSDVRGVYVIADAWTGKLYVGSATGEGGPLGSLVRVLGQWAWREPAPAPVDSRQRRRLPRAPAFRDPGDCRLERRRRRHHRARTALEGAAAYPEHGYHDN